MFNAQVEAFVSDYRLLVWDARGHGQSQSIGAAFSLEHCAQDMLAILDELGVAQAILCGQSPGGYIAQHIYQPDHATVFAAAPGVLNYLLTAVADHTAFSF